MATSNVKVFKIEPVLCEARRLGDVMAALSGLLIDPPIATMVTNVGIDDTTGKLQPLTKGRMIDLFERHLHETRVGEFSAKFVKEFVRDQGRAENSYSSILTEAQKRGLVKKTPKGQKGYGTRYISKVHSET